VNKPAFLGPNIETCSKLFEKSMLHVITMLFCKRVLSSFSHLENKEEEQEGEKVVYCDHRGNIHWNVRIA